MTTYERITQLIQQGLDKKGGRRQLAEYLGVTPNAITEWMKSRARPNAHHLIRLQDLVKKAACVLLVIGGTASAPQDASAQFDSTRIPAPTYYTFYSIQRLRKAISPIAYFLATLLQQVIKHLMNVRLPHPLQA